MRTHRTLFGILAVAALLAAVSYAGIKPSANATRQEVEADTTLAVKGVLDIESGGSLKFNGTAFSAADYVPVTKAGQQTITATGAGNDLTLSTLASGDDIIAQAGGDISLESGAAGATAVVSATVASLFSPDGNTSLVAADDLVTLATSATGTISLSANANGVYIYGDGGTKIDGLVRLEPTATPPAACAGGTEGGLYVDSNTHLLCICNGTAWVQVADGTTGCS